MRKKKKIIPTFALLSFIGALTVAGWHVGIQEYISPDNWQSSLFGLESLSHGQLVIPGTYLSIASSVAEKLVLRFWHA